MDRGLSKSLKKAFFSFLNSVPLIIKSNRGLEQQTSCFLFTKQVQKNSLISGVYSFYYLIKFYDVIWSGLWVIPKIMFANSCKPVHDIMNYSTFINPFESEKCWKKGKKYKNIYLENEKSFLDEIKRIFHSFLNGYHLVKE